MKRSSNFLTVLIILVAFLAILINIPDTLTLPIAKQPIKLVNINTLLKPLNLAQDISFKKGLDLQGGTSITLRANMKDIPEAQRKDALESAKEVIERRINFFGVSEPLIQTSQVNDDYRIIVEIPGITDVNQAVSLIGQTAQLSFWEEGASPSAQEAQTTPSLPLGVDQILGSNAHNTGLTGKDLKKAAVTFNQSTGEPQVELSFTSSGTQKFADITKRNVGKIVGIVLDNQLIQAPRVNQPILTGQAEITGQFTIPQAKALQIQLNAGALPISLSVLQQQAIGATLGDETVKKSLIAGGVGFLIIVIYIKWNTEVC